MILYVVFVLTAAFRVLIWTGQASILRTFTCIVRMTCERWRACGLTVPGVFVFSHTRWSELTRELELSAHLRYCANRTLIQLHLVQDKDLFGLNGGSESYSTCTIVTSNDLLNYEELLRQFNRDLQQGRSSYHKRTRASQLHQCSMISIISQIRRFTFATRRRLKFGTGTISAQCSKAGGIGACHPGIIRCRWAFWIG